MPKKRARASSESKEEEQREKSIRRSKREKLDATDLSLGDDIREEGSTDDEATIKRESATPEIAASPERELRQAYELVVYIEFEVDQDAEIESKHIQAATLPGFTAVRHQNVYFTQRAFFNAKETANSYALRLFDEYGNRKMGTRYSSIELVPPEGLIDCSGDGTLETKMDIRFIIKIQVVEIVVLMEDGAEVLMKPTSKRIMEHSTKRGTFMEKTEFGFVDA